MSAARLQGLGVVITRPLDAARVLAAALEREGARPFVFPALAIEPIEPSRASADALAQMPRCTLAIFVSANAVEFGMALARRGGAWPAAARVAAVGDATARALQAAGFEQVIAPRERYDSDALAALPELRAVKGETILVFRGEGGREHLRAVLESRGADVYYVECYRRGRPKADPAPLLRAWSDGQVHAVSALSAETLENFLTMLGEGAQPLLGRATLVVPHPNIAAHPDARRFARTLVAAPGAEGLVQALSQLQVTP